MKMISRKEARASGLKEYFTGKPCKRNHISLRRVKLAVCIECEKERHIKYRVLNKDKQKAYGRKYRKTSSYKDRKTFREAKRRASKLSATPKWSNLKEIARIYKDCPQGMHVDHIIPLQGKTVCGLHVPENLQYLSPLENVKKKNKFNGTIHLI